jgi:hypothetical protein
MTLTVLSSTDIPFSLDRVESKRKAAWLLSGRIYPTTIISLVIHFMWSKETNCVLALKEEIDV